MQEQRNSNSGFQNRGSYFSRIHSNMSIDRTAIRSNSPSIYNRISLVDAMEIEIPQRKSDIYQNILGDQRYSNHKRQSNISRGEANSKIQRQSANQGQILKDQQIVKQQHQQRYSSQKIIHQCNCERQCNQQHCNCFMYPNELCVIGLCCPNCVKQKNIFLAKQEDFISTNGCLCKNIKCLKMYCTCFRNGKKCNKNLCKCQGCENDSNHLIQKRRKHEFDSKKQQILRKNYHLSHINKTVNPLNYQFFSCSCKKSHCLKKYCSCFLNNKPCNQTCICEDCHNIYEDNDNEEQKNRKARYARHDVQNQFIDDQNDNLNQIDKFLQQDEDFEAQNLHQNMEFQPVHFQNV